MHMHNGSRRGALTPLAVWGTATLCVAATGVGIALEIANQHGPYREHTVYPGAIVLATLFPIVGALIATRQPRNTIGWVLLCMGVSEAVTGLAAPYAVFAFFTQPHATPVATWASWIATWFWFPGFGLVPLLVLLFPTGRPPAPRWAAITWLPPIGTVLAATATAVNAWPSRGLRLVGLSNGVPFTSGGVLSLLNELGTAVLIVGLVSAIGGLVWRFTTARGRERQQLKWFTYFAVLAVVALIASIALLPNGGYLNGQLLDSTLVVLQSLAFAAIPASIGVAILRHRLYDIDVLINRTLVYGSLTALLVLVYFTVVVVLQAVGRAVTGQRGDSTVVIVGSTLLIAALFQPLRRRVQRTIDRRFYRSKYDAAKTVERFAATLRQEVELEQFRSHLVDTVQETMQPEHVSLWLRRT